MGIGGCGASRGGWGRFLGAGEAGAAEDEAGAAPAGRTGKVANATSEVAKQLQNHVILMVFAWFAESTFCSMEGKKYMG